MMHDACVGHIVKVAESSLLKKKNDGARLSPTVLPVRDEIDTRKTPFNFRNAITAIAQRPDV